MMTRLSAKPVLTAAAIVMAAMLVSACGLKGPLEPPGGKVSSEQGEGKSSEAADPGSNSGVKPKPHEGFILDPLLR